MDIIVQVLFGGVSIGLIYGLPALGIVLLFNTAGFFNLAQGEFLALSTYVLYQVYVLWKIPLLLSIVITVGVMIAAGLFVNLVLFTPLRKFNAKELYILIATIALSIFMKNFMRLIWKSKPLNIMTIFPQKPLKLLGANVMPSVLWILGISLILIFLLFILSQKSKLGTGMRAASEHKEAASLMGIAVDKVIGLSFAISLAITAVAGILSTSVLYMIPEMGDSISTKAFAATVIGGFGNPVGAIVGGIILGVIETIASMILPASYKNAITFLLLIAFLLFKPTGIFKTSSNKKV